MTTPRDLSKRIAAKAKDMLRLGARLEEIVPRPSWMAFKIIVNKDLEGTASVWLQPPGSAARSSHDTLEAQYIEAKIRGRIGRELAEDLDAAFGAREVTLVLKPLNDKAILSIDHLHVLSCSSNTFGHHLSRVMKHFPRASTPGHFFAYQATHWCPEISPPIANRLVRAATPGDAIRQVAFTKTPLGARGKEIHPILAGRVETIARLTPIPGVGDLVICTKDHLVIDDDVAEVFRRLEQMADGLPRPLRNITLKASSNGRANCTTPDPLLVTPAELMRHEEAKSRCLERMKECLHALSAILPGNAIALKTMAYSSGRCTSQIHVDRHYVDEPGHIQLLRDLPQPGDQPLRSFFVATSDDPMLARFVPARSAHQAAAHYIFSMFNGKRTTNPEGLVVYAAEPCTEEEIREACGIETA